MPSKAAVLIATDSRNIAVSSTHRLLEKNVMCASGPFDNWLYRMHAQDHHTSQKVPQTPSAAAAVLVTCLQHWSLCRMPCSRCWALLSQHYAHPIGCQRQPKASQSEPANGILHSCAQPSADPDVDPRYAIVCLTLRSELEERCNLNTPQMPETAQLCCWGDEEEAGCVLPSCANPT